MLVPKVRVRVNMSWKEVATSDIFARAMRPDDALTASILSPSESKST